MLIWEQMGVRKTGCFVVFVVLSCVLVTAVSFGSRKEADEVIIGDPHDSASLEIDDGMAEVLWNYCGRDILQMKEAIEVLNIPRSPLLGKENLQKAMSIQHPIMKQTLLDCLIKNHLLVRVSGEDGQSKNWIIGYLESVFLKPDTRKRVFGRELLQSSMETLSPSPSPGLGPSPSPAPAPTASQPPAMSPAPIFIGQESNSTFEPPSDDGLKTASTNSSAPLNKNSTNHKPVVIAVAVTASVTFVFAVLLFCCYTKVWKKSSRLNDNRPLLSLSMNDYGSSPNAFSVGNKYDSSLNGNYYTQSVIANSSVSQTQTVPLGTLGGHNKYSVEPPIDTSNNIIAEVPLAPLKPPPGRVNDSPPQLPSPKPPPSTVPPTPPQAPAPPPPRAPAPPPPPRAPAPPPPPPLKPTGGVGPPAPGPPPLPPKPPGISSGSRPPPPPRPGVGPPRPPPMALGGKARPPPGPKPPSNATSGSGGDVDNESEAAKAKLKPFFWDKVLANPDQSMVWHQIKSGSFQFDEDMIESLFGYAAAPEKNKNDPSKGSSSQERPAQFIQIIDAKKAQNLSILLRALNVTTEEVCDAIQEGNELSVELLQTLLKVAPTQDEELKLRLFNGELSQLGTAERFLKTLVDIPFAFKRLEALAFMGSLQEEVSNSKESFSILEVACKELRSSRIFLKLLEAVLKTGNRMNTGTFRGGAQAFKLDTLLKLSDVKGTDGKTTLLHFVVQEIIRSEGIRAARTARESQSSMSSIKLDDLLEDSTQDMEEQYRSLGLEVVSGLGDGLEHVKRAANLDTDGISVTVTKLGHALVQTRDFLNTQIMSMDEQNGFRKALESFVQNAEVDIMWLLEEEKRIMALVKSTGDYFHGNAGKEDGLRLFVIVRDFLIILDKTCKQVRDAPKKPKMIQKVEATPAVVASASSDPRPPSSPDIRQRLFPGITDRRADNSSSDDESS